MQFPRGYWLYERSKHLWVSGYPVKAKLFKSPQEFGLHLIWLMSSSKDYADCCCVHCNMPSMTKVASSEDGSLVIIQPDVIKPEKVPPRVTPVPLPTIVGQPQPPPTPTPPQPLSAQFTAPAPTNPPPTPVAQAPPVTKPAPQPTAAAIPQPTSWPLQSSLLFRPGEMVWYQNGNAWRLGIIAMAGNGTHEIMPLGHAMVGQQHKTKTESEMRPFHAFSVPPVAVAELKDKLFDNIPWDVMFRATGNDTGKVDLLNLDASKMAASKIDYSYSLWSALSDDLGSKTIAYYGAFLGAERIEVGDCLRVGSLPPELNMNVHTAILGLRGIFTTTDYPGAVFLRGHIYQAVQGDARAAAASVVVADENLPVALRDETQWRNQLDPAQAWRWALARENVVLKEPSVRGRFYPTHRLLPILDPAGFQAAVAQRHVQEPYLNNRMDGAGGYLGRKRNRVDALGATVQHGAHVSLEPHVREEAFSAFEAL